MAKILLIEDNEMNRDMLSRRLQRKGHDVAMAVDGRQGIEMAQAGAYDLILMDMSLPELDGWETTRQLRGFPATQGIPIIALTEPDQCHAEPDPPHRERGGGRGLERGPAGTAGRHYRGGQPAPGLRRHPARQ